MTDTDFDALDARDDLDTETEGARLLAWDDGRMRAAAVAPEPEPEPLSATEAAADRVAGWDMGQVRELTGLLAAANAADAERVERTARAGTEGYDGAGDPVVVGERVDMAALSDEAFDALVAAASNGGSVQRPPAGYSRLGFQAVVDAAMGRG